MYFPVQLCDIAAPFILLLLLAPLFLRIIKCVQPAFLCIGAEIDMYVRIIDSVAADIVFRIASKIQSPN